jgi:phosphoglycolate phosphatase
MRLAMKFRGIIFDCDGVLILSTNEIYDEALTLTIRSFKPEFPEERLQQIMMKTRGKTFVHQLRLILGSDYPDLDDAIKFYESYIHLDSVYHRILPLEGVEAVLSEMKSKGYKLAMATGMNPSLLARLFQEGILPEIFDDVANVHSIADPELQKPNPKILLDLLSTLRLTPAEAVYVGDTEDDVEMAKRCGVFPVAVLTGRLKEKQAHGSGASLILASALELPRWI